MVIVLKFRACKRSNILFADDMKNAKYKQTFILSTQLKKFTNHTSLKITNIVNYCMYLYAVSNLCFLNPSHSHMSVSLG